MGLSNMMDLVSRSTLFCLATCIFERERELNICPLNRANKKGENSFDKKKNDLKRNEIEASEF
jgi:hypothetical protein